MKTSITRRSALIALSSTAAVALPGMSWAQADRPVKFILPNATGSGVDAITRAAAPALGKALGTNVVVENQAGASGVIGLQALAKNPPPIRRLPLPALSAPPLSFTTFTYTPWPPRWS